ncbi:MAG: transcription antitermination factor NusB [Gammaproteobacteria bacterium]|nr:transcription antitermination factor NusB [Gammaproteobacteria bacterium]MYD81120.1 transcription antitermination factor NusB [Gammaproteobacteria bacterium]
MNKPSSSVAQSSPRHRRQSRRVLLQAIYQWDMAGSTEKDMVQFFTDEGSLDKADKRYFHDCLHGVMRGVKDLDRAFEPYLDRTLSELNPVERSCLRAGCYELIEREDVPFKVIINEWVDLAKLFGAQDSYRYINAVLDAVARTAREREE